MESRTEGETSIAVLRININTTHTHTHTKLQRTASWFICPAFHRLNLQKDRRRRWRRARRLSSSEQQTGYRIPQHFICLLMPHSRLHNKGNSRTLLKVWHYFKEGVPPIAFQDRSSHLMFYLHLELLTLKYLYSSMSYKRQVHWSWQHLTLGWARGGAWHWAQGVAQVFFRGAQTRRE